MEELKRLQHPQEHHKKWVNTESQQDYDVPVGNDTGSKGEDVDDVDNGNDALLDQVGSIVEVISLHQF